METICKLPIATYRTFDSAENDMNKISVLPILLKTGLEKRLMANHRPHLYGENVSRVKGHFRLSELSWASQLFLHFFTKLGKTFT